MQKRGMATKAGIDDATKCPCIGSIFVSGVVADKNTVAYWKKIGVKDSKLISPKKRFRLATVIKETAKSFSIQEITPFMIDDKRLNLNDREMLVVLKIVQELYQKDAFSITHIDNWEVSEKRFQDRYSKLVSMNQQCTQKGFHLNTHILSSIELRAEHKADERYTIVGAASILSKTSSDRQYQDYKEQFGNFGSGSPADPRTRLFVFNNRHNPPHIIRKSWNTYKTLMALESIEHDPIYRRLKDKSR